MNLAFAGFRHSHIIGLYRTALECAGVKIMGCFEENAIEREKMRSILSCDFNYSSYEEILKDRNVHAVAIADYYSKRGEMVIAALKSGKHVITDKPICTNLWELEEIERLTQETGLKLACMLDLRYMAQASTVREMIQRQDIGEIINVSFTGQHFLDYGNREEWYFEEGKHGGTINDIAIHGLDLVRCITGKNLTRINCAKERNAFATEVKNFMDCGQFMIEMDNISLMADVSYAAPKCNKTLPTYWDFYFWGLTGMINFRSSEKVIHLYQGTETVIECEKLGAKYLFDFIDEINGKGYVNNTKYTLESQRQILKIQEEATKCSK